MTQRIHLFIIIFTTVAPICAQIIEYKNVSANLIHVPSDIPTEAQRVDLSDNQIADIPSDIFTNHHQLWFLILTHNQLVEFPNLTAAAANLDSLELMDNQIETINPDLVNIFNKLKFINLNNNPLGSVPVLTTSLGTLTRLLLQNCLLNTPPVIANPSNLYELQIGENLFNTIPNDYFLGMISLRILWVNNLGVSEFIKLPEGTVIEDVYAHNILITSVSELAMKRMTHLKKLVFPWVSCSSDNNVINVKCLPLEISISMPNKPLDN